MHIVWELHGIRIMYYKAIRPTLLSPLLTSFYVTKSQPANAPF